MKKINIITFFAALIIFMSGCEEEDYTGYSTLVPTNPTITVDFGTIATVSDGLKSTHTVNLTMSEAQIVDVAVHVFVSAGDATEGADFTLSTGVVTINAGRTTGKFVVSVLPDELVEATETFDVTVGDERTANATIAPVTATFTITNATSDNLALSLSWAGDAYETETGDAIDATDIADMIFLVQDMSFATVGGADGASFEDILLDQTLADGDYYLATAFYAAMDASIDLDFSLDYSQVGVQSGGFSYSGAMNTSANIDNTLYLAKLTKAGTTFTISEFEGFVASDIDFASSSWNDGAGDGCGYGGFFANEVVIAGTDGSYTIDGLNYAWMLNAWGETVKSSTPMGITFNNDGTLSVAEGAYMITLYDSDDDGIDEEFTYRLVNHNGTWNQYMLPVSLTINYDMMDGADTEWGSWLYDNGYSSTPTFIADIIQGSSAKKRTVNTPNKPIENIKPY